MQEQAFATCVKSLASKFSQMASVEDDVPDYASFGGKQNIAAEKVWCGTSEVFFPPPPPPPLHSAVMQPADAAMTGSSEFPPPPTPLCQSAEDLRDGNAFSSFCADKQMQSPDRSLSSSSNESLPFANDNVGTIRQSQYQNCSLHPASLNQNLNTMDDLAASLLPFPQSPSSPSPVVMRRVSTAAHPQNLFLNSCI